MASPRFLPVIGLVGGVGSGKSSIANHLKSRRRVAVIDGDAAGHIVLNDPAIKRRIRQEFGDSVFDNGGQVDRSRLGRRVFGDSPQQRRNRDRLEQAVHPHIKKLLAEQIEQARQSGRVEAVLLDAAVLLEAGWNDLCNSIVFVDTPLPLRRRRVADTRGWDEKTLAARESSQWPLERKRRQANFTIENSGGLDDAARQLELAVEATVEATH